MFQKRWYQQEAEQSIFDYFESGKTGNPIVAMPTGTGKGVVIASLLNRIFGNWPNQNVIKMTHVKELISQNHTKLKQLWPSAPVGIYSAGLKSRDLIQPILFGGVQSVAKAIKRGEKFGKRDLMLIDECHLLSPDEDTQYQFVINELKEQNPYLKVIGFTATKYRLKQGLLTDGGLFTDTCYDVTGVDAFNRLVAEGYLAPLISKHTDTEIDLSEVGIRGGEYIESELEEASERVTFEACQELYACGYDRHCWMVFAASIKHAESIASILQSMGVAAAAVHSKLSNVENNRRIEAFKTGKLRCLVNKDKLTTGFDFAPIDLIAMLRATCSPGLWVQMLGRETRPYNPDMCKYIPGFDYIKYNGLVLDFAGNTKRLGPINDPVLPRKPGKATGEVPIKICPKCNVYNHAAARHCCNCGFEFPFNMTLYETASTEAIMRNDLPVVEYFKVQKVLYNLHEKEGSKPSIKVSYFCGDSPFQTKQFSEWICLEHEGFAAKRARDWWRDRHWDEPPETTSEALQRVSELRMPSRLRIWMNKKPKAEVLGYEF